MSWWIFWIFNSALRARKFREQIPSGGLILYMHYKASITAQGLPEPSSLRGSIHWVPEQLNVMAVAGACKLIDGCSLVLCLATVSVASAGKCHRNEKSIQLHDCIEGLSREIVSITLHYITLHYITLHYITLRYVTLRHVTSRHVTSRHVTLRYVTLRYVTLRYVTLRYVTLRYVTLRYVTLHYITLHYITLHYITLHYITLHYITY